MNDTLSWAVAQVKRKRNNGEGWGQIPINVWGLDRIMNGVSLAVSLPLSKRRAEFLLDCVVAADAMLRAANVYDGFERMAAEYERAITKHGVDKVLTSPTMGDDLKFFAVTEEIGEVARCLTYDQEHAGEFVEEVVQLGGLCLAWAQGIHDSWESK